MKLGLGSAQFGLDYGITNKRGQIPFEEVARILQKAEEDHVQVIDTAFQYGESETVLGKVLKKNHPFRIVTKTMSNTDAQAIRNGFDGSLEKLKQSSVYGLLIHDVEDVLAEKGDALWAVLEEIKKQGRAEKIGVSVYSRDQIDQVLDRYAIDLIQVPVNVFDQRLIHSGHLKRLKERNVEIHSRSVFLQGVLATAPEDLDPFLSRLCEPLEQYRASLKENNLSAIDGAIGFIKSIDEIDTAVVGISSEHEFNEVIDSYSRTNIVSTPWKRFSVSDEDLLDPSRWKLAHK